MRIDFIFFIHELLHTDKSFMTHQAKYDDRYRHLFKRDVDGELRDYLDYIFVRYDLRLTTLNYLESKYNHE